MFMTLVYFLSLSPKDYFDMLSTLTASIASLTAILISLNSNRIAKEAALDNNKMIEESLRPAIAIYPVFFDAGSVIYTLILKNVGSSVCTIKEFKSDCDFDKNDNLIKRSDNKLVSLGVNISGLTLGPMQSKHINLNRLNLPKEIVTFQIIYGNDHKTYYETTKINLNAATEIPIIVPESKNKELEYIYKVLYENFKNNL